MSETLYATFDGQVLRPERPISLEPNTRVRLTIESAEAGEPRGNSFLETARGLELEGPADWSERLEEYCTTIVPGAATELFRCKG